MRHEARIITGYAGKDALGKYISDGGLNIAMSAGAMLALDSMGEAYLTFDDLYPMEEFRSELALMTVKVEGLFDELDDASSQQAGFARPYRANIYWFVIFLANLLYLARVARELKARSESQRLLVGRFLKAGNYDLDPCSIGPESDGLTFQNYYYGLQNKVDLLASALGPGLVQTTLVGEERQRAGEIAYILSSARFRARYMLTKTWRDKAFEAISSAFAGRKGPGTKKGSIFVIQDKYEVRWLKRYLSDYRFICPMEEVRAGGLAKKHDAGSFHAVRDLVDRFARERLPLFRDHLLDLFSAYHNNVVTTLRSFTSSFEGLMAERSPRALFYSIGAHNVIEEVCADAANRAGIPVFYFQHGGASAYTHDPYQKYFEENGNIERIRIMRSPVEAEETADSTSVNKALGSMTLHRLFVQSASLRGRARPGRPAEKVLYLCSAFSTHAYKDLLLTVPDCEKYRINRDIVGSVSARGIKMDIKLDTVDERTCRDYFTNLVRSAGASGIRVLHRIPAESIIGSYGLVIVEYLTSALTSVVLMLDIPVVCYLPDRSSVKPGFIDTLKKRTYLVEDRASLDEVLDRFARTGLDSRWMPELVDRYAFHRQGGDPGPKIASYVRGVIETA